jgi:hypothetical protein
MLTSMTNKDYSILGCCVMQSCRDLQMFQRCLLPLSFVPLMMEAVSTLEAPDSFYKITQCNIPEDSDSSSYLLL